MTTVLSSIRRIRVRAEKVTGLRRLAAELAETFRFQIDRDAREMQMKVTVPLIQSLTGKSLSHLKRFGRGRGAPIVVIHGLPYLRHPPSTPADGFVDESVIAGVDSVLLGLLGLARLHPIAYEHENGGRLMRDIVARLGSVGEISSHGHDRRFGEHTDNLAGPFELEAWSGSPIPRVLTFHCLRNRDASGWPVPTDIVPVDCILAVMSDRAKRTLRRPVFRLNPPASNRLRPVEGIPLLVGDERVGGPFFRYDGNNDGDLPRVEGLTADARRTLAELREKINQSAAMSVDLQPGRVLLLDNYRVLHARRAFDAGPDWRTARWLRRCYACQNPKRGEYADALHSPFVWK